MNIEKIACAALVFCWFTATAMAVLISAALWVFVIYGLLKLTTNL